MKPQMTETDRQNVNYPTVTVSLGIPSTENGILNHLSRDTHMLKKGIRGSLD